MGCVVLEYRDLRVGDRVTDFADEARLEWRAFAGSKAIDKRRHGGGGEPGVALENGVEVWVDFCSGWSVGKKRGLRVWDVFFWRS